MPVKFTNHYNIIENTFILINPKFYLAFDCCTTIMLLILVQKYQLCSLTLIPEFINLWFISVNKSVELYFPEFNVIVSHIPSISMFKVSLIPPVIVNPVDKSTFPVIDDGNDVPPA